MHTHWMILLKCNIAMAKGKYHIAFDFYQINAWTEQKYDNAIPSILLN
jgi:hypothetical protein